MVMRNHSLLTNFGLLWLSLAGSLLQVDAQSNVAEDELIPIIAVVDIGGPDQGSMSRSWFDFRTEWPDRPFCVLRLEGANPILAPSAMFRDNNVIVANVNRDGGDTFKQSDWYDLCQVDDTAVRSVALLVDVSVAVVAASLDYFETQITQAGYEILMAVPREDNNWIEAMNVRFTSSNSPSRSPTELPSVSPSLSPSAVPSRSPSEGPTGADGISQSTTMRLSMTFREGFQIEAQEDFNQQQLNSLQDVLAEYLNNYIQTEVVGNTYIGTTAKVVTTIEVGDNNPGADSILFYEGTVSAEFRNPITNSEFVDILEALNLIPLAFAIYSIDDNFMKLEEIVSFQSI